MSTQVKKGEEVKRWTTVDTEKSVVTKHHVTQHGEGDSKTFHQLTWKFDFSNVTQEQLLELASRDLVIKKRTGFRGIPVKEIPQWDGITFDVAEFMKKERSKLSPMERAKKAVGNLSEEDRQALLKELQG